SCSPASGSFFALGTTTVLCTATDASGNTATGSFPVRVLQGPLITSLSVPAAPVAVGSPIAAMATYLDGAGLTDTCTFDWDDGASSTVTGSGGGCSAPHAYSVSDVYTVTVTVANDLGNSASLSATTLVVVFNPTGGFVTGGGTIESPAGAYTADP